MLVETIKVGLVGLGTVGKGTLEVLCRNQDEIIRRAGVEILVTSVASRDIQKTQHIINNMQSCVQKPLVHSHAIDVANDDDIDVLVDVAKDVILQAIKNKKHIVTANKALIANHGKEIFELARQHNVVVAFEAAVAGGVPIIKALREGLSANHIHWLAGIVNGTTNFILSEMDQKGLSFDSVLKQAQELGYAEADPTFDIEGIDAGHKTSIMSSLAFGIPIQFSKAHIEGITKIQSCDMAYAQELGYKIKLLGIAKNQNNGIELRVHPALLPKEHILANVNGAMNAVMVSGDAVGQTLYYGKGAGSEPTASAVIADLVDVVRDINNHNLDINNRNLGRVPPLAFQNDAIVNTPVLNIEEISTRYYLRLKVDDKAGIMAIITSALASQNISIRAILQKEPQDKQQVDVIILTDIAKEGDVNNALEHIQKAIHLQDSVKIRLELLNN
jgi:homoserine dehydrogenase